jgi:hypothetical protein
MLHENPKINETNQLDEELKSEQNTISISIDQQIETLADIIVDQLLKDLYDEK